MIIKVHNDGKEKGQSFDAYIDIMDFTYESSVELRVNGYGSTEEEAILNLKNRFYTVIKEISIPILNDQKREYVDYKGEKI